jgi:hypothetical protein
VSEGLCALQNFSLKIPCLMGYVTAKATSSVVFQAKITWSQISDASQRCSSVFPHTIRTLHPCKSQVQNYNWFVQKLTMIRLDSPAGCWLLPSSLVSFGFFFPTCDCRLESTELTWWTQFGPHVLRLCDLLGYFSLVLPAFLMNNIPVEPPKCNVISLPVGLASREWSSASDGLRLGKWE